MTDTDLTHGSVPQILPQDFSRYRKLMQWPVLVLALAGLCTVAWWVLLGWALITLFS